MMEKKVNKSVKGNKVVNKAKQYMRNKIRACNSSSVKTIIHGENIQIYYAPYVSDIEALITTGCIPIEMSVDGVNYVDDLKINHSNGLSHQPANCVTSLKYYGVARSRKRSFIVNNMTLDSIMSAIILLGMIPQELCEQVVPTVAMETMDHLNPDFRNMPYYNEVSIWNNAMMTSNNRAGANVGPYGWLFGMSLWIDLLTNSAPWKERIDLQRNNDANRIATAEEDYLAGTVMPSGKVVMIPSSRVFGMDVHFHRIPDTWSNQLSGWKHWVTLVFIEKTRRITLACPNEDISQALFGKGGLKNVYDKLPKLPIPEDTKEEYLKDYQWGGKASVGGSPIAGDATDEMLYAAADIVDNLVKKAIGI